MAQIDIDSLLSQMRTLSAQLQPNAAPAPASADAQVPDSFGNLLKQSISDVAQLQDKAQQLSAAFDRGDPSANLPQVMLAVEKAQLSFQAMSQVRNKLVNAYTDIMNMPM